VDVAVAVDVDVAVAVAIAVAVADPRRERANVISRQDDRQVRPQPR